MSVMSFVPLLVEKNNTRACTFGMDHCVNFEKFKHMSFTCKFNLNKSQRNSKGQSRMGNPETLATFVIQDTGRRQTK